MLTISDTVRFSSYTGVNVPDTGRALRTVVVQGQYASRWRDALTSLTPGDYQLGNTWRLLVSDVFSVYL
jgi:hypothetical protein